ncbi:family 16 glycosylhydrolase [Psychroflexus aestuariivivens]|uniref:family 16 glycosylhydrolase n=1 Tax=Psychroflexus aestuariivivens TaxID=1795040 RepID=UPI000FD870A1|nr:family 16 glycosylhydrolase [Psychroflexus aestuariivivens]
MRSIILQSFLFIIGFSAFSQTLTDDFEGNSSINSWFADDCLLNTEKNNPYINSNNPSATVLEYQDNGGAYANIGFNSETNINISENAEFSLKIYVPSDGITGNQNNQISLKLQNANINEPWSTQSEVIKNLSLDEWQEVTFNFVNDNYINLDPNSPPPSSRSDFNRVVLQINGENNTDEVLAFIDDFYFEGEEQGSGNPGNDPVYDELVWSDEFDEDGALDNSKWFHQTEIPNGSSWFNGEVQHYTDRLENTYVEDGIMNLVAKAETFTDQGVTKNYTSARLNSKFAFTYGRVEVRAKLPTGVGTWPAIWMLGKNISENGAYWYNEGFGTTGWPACGEIDIMEHWGTNQNFVQSAMHTPSSYGGTINHGGQVIPTASTEFHTYTLDWYPDRMVFSVDGVEHYTYQPEVQDAATWPFDSDQYLLLNTAIQPSISNNFTESTFEVDYVRIYQEDGLGTENQIVKTEVRIYPNPANTQTTLEIPESVIGSKASIFTVQGQFIGTEELKSRTNSIDMSTWESGVYIFKIEGKNTSQFFKIIKK